MSHMSHMGRIPAARRYQILLPLCCAGVAVLCVLHIATGTVALTPGEVIAALAGQPAEPYQRIIVWDLRLPRTLIALATGAMFGLSGAILQAITRNPLAEPEMTGATSGAVLAAVLWIAQGPVQAQIGPALPFVALLGGVVASGAVYLLSGPRRGHPAGLILTGLVVAAVLRSCTSLVLLVRQEALGSILIWLIGSLNGRVWVHWETLWPWALVSLPLGLSCARWANVLQLGHISASGLGVRVEWARAGLLFVAALLAAGAVAIVGGIVFLGLIAPHIARRLVGADARRVFPMSIVLAAGLLLAADILAQVALRPITLPVGAVVAAVGAPFFLYLLRRRGV